MARVPQNLIAVAYFYKFITVSAPHFNIGMCLKENYSDSPSNEYSRHYSAEYLRRQNMNSKLGEEQKKKRSSRP